MINNSADDLELVAALEAKFTQLQRVISGGCTFSLSKTTQSRAIATLNVAEPPTDTIVISLLDSGGKLCSWYNGPIKLAIAETATNGTAAISPASTTPNMTNGVYTVVVSYGYSSTGWANGDAATLTVSDPDTPAGIAGRAISDATFVMSAITGS